MQSDQSLLPQGIAANVAVGSESDDEAVPCFLYVLAFLEMPNVVKCGCGSGDDKVRFVKVGLRHVPGIRVF